MKTYCVLFATILALGVASVKPAIAGVGKDDISQIERRGRHKKGAVMLPQVSERRKKHHLIETEF